MVADGAADYARGLALAARGREEEARAAFQAALPEVGEPCQVELALLDVRGRRNLEAALGTARDVAARARERGEAALRARALHVAGLALGKLRRNREAVDSLVEARDLYRELGDGAGLARVQDTLASVQASLGQLEAAASLYAISLVRKVLAGDRQGVALTLGNLGRLQLRAGRHADALECFDLDLELAREQGDRRGETRMHLDRGRALRAMGRLEDAEAALREGIALAARCGLRDLEFFGWKDLVLVHLRREELTAAERALGRARTLLRGGRGEPYLESVLRAAEAELLLARGDEAGLALLARAVREFAEAELPDEEIPALLRLAEAQAERQRKVGAEACLRRAQRLARREGRARYLPVIREAFGRLALVQGAVEEEEGRLVVEEGRPVSTDGGYTLLRRLGSGAFGEVHAALDPEAHRVVAIKRMRLDDLYDPRERQRVLAAARIELEAASRVRHAGIARVLALGADSAGGAYLVQEYVEGEPLRVEMGREPVDPVRVLEVSRDLALALESLHAEGIVHRDVKPENIIIRERDGRPVLLDLGIARLPRRPGSGAAEFLAGTLAYMAPEQARCEAVDGRADVWALGVVLYEWLAGELPLDLPRDDFGAALAAVRDPQPRPLARSNSEVPEELASLVDALLEPDSRLRPRASGFARACNHFLSHGSFPMELLLDSG